MHTATSLRHACANSTSGKAASAVGSAHAPALEGAAVAGGTCQHSGRGSGIPCQRKSNPGRIPRGSARGEEQEPCAIAGQMRQMPEPRHVRGQIPLRPQSVPVRHLHGGVPSTAAEQASCFRTPRRPCVCHSVPGRRHRARRCLSARGCGSRCRVAARKSLLAQRGRGGCWRGGGARGGPSRDLERDGVTDGIWAAWIDGGNGRAFGAQAAGGHRAPAGVHLAGQGGVAAPAEAQGQVCGSPVDQSRTVGAAEQELCLAPAGLRPLQSRPCATGGGASQQKQQGQVSGRR